nr:MAG TPA: hypothetical protein [Myoviridae sp. ctNhr24]
MVYYYAKTPIWHINCIIQPTVCKYSFLLFLKIYNRFVKN